MAGAKRVTIVEVAREVGVSPSTVSLVLRGDRSIPDPTVDRVRDAMHRLGYVYNRRAASLRDRQVRMLGVVVHDLANGVMTEIALGANMAARELGYVQLLAHTDDDPTSQHEVIHGLREYGVEGLLLSPTQGTTAAELSELRDAGMTVVLVGRGIEGGSVSCVRSDNASGVVSAVEHLHALGHRRISFVGGRPGTDTFQARSRTFVAAMGRLGLPVGEESIIASGQSPDGGREGLRVLLARRAGLPSAVMCFNDSVAIGVYEGLRAVGLRPGEDLSVIGFDDSEAARALYPALTTVSIGAQELGEQATRLLTRLLETKRSEPTEIVNPVRLVIRDSCTPV